MNKKVTYILFCILAIGFIFFNSSKNGIESNNMSKSLVNKVLYNEETVEVFNNIKSSTNDLDLNGLEKDLNFIIRKSAHITEYFILAFILIIVFNNLKIKFREKYIYSLFIVLIIAVLDEFYQSYVPYRSSLVSDVVIDFIGGICGALVSSIIMKIKILKKSS